MTLKAQKPEINADVDAFIKGAQAEAPVREELSGKKDKSFLLKLPYDVWKKARQKAGDVDITLHNYIVDAIKQKNKD